MILTNKHRDLYKVINNYQKKGKINNFKYNNDEKILLKDLESEKFIKFVNNTYIINKEKTLPKKQKEKAYRILLTKDKKRIYIKRCEKPKFAGRGRTWNKYTQLVNNIRTDFYIDTSWGYYIYFETTDGRWYKISLKLENEDLYYNNMYYDIEEMFTKNKIEFTIHY